MRAGKGEWADAPCISPAPVEYYINQESIYLEHVNTSFYRAVPGILTGLGLLFTFIGLAAGVYDVYNSPDPEKLQRIDVLLSGAGQAFISSIVGLVCSILFQVYFKNCENRIFVQINNITRHINEIVHFITPERVQLEMYFQLNSQNEKMDQFGQSWNLEMEKIFDKLLAEQTQMTKEMSSKLVEAINSVNIALEVMSKNQVEHILSVLQEASQAFGEQLGDRIQEMTEYFSKTASDLTQAADTLRKVFNGINERIDEVAARTHEHMQPRISDWLAV